MHDVGVLRTSLAIVVAGLAAGLLTGAAACGPKSTGSGPSTGAMPAPVARYAGLRWVPADATYVIATHRTEDAVLIARELVDVLGLAGEFDAAQVGRDSARALGGLDVLSTADLAEHGIDVTRGVAIFSRGLSPTFAVPLADPQRFAAFIEEQRRGGAVVQVARAHDLDVHTFRPHREVAFHWVFAGDWFLAHFEHTDEHEVDGAWLDAAIAARGGFAAEADLVAALDEGQRRLGAEPPLVAVARTPQLLAHPLIREPAACADTLGRLGRIIAVGAVAAPDARGAIVAEVAGGVDGVRALRTPVPAGWARARAEAPIQLDAGFDLRTAAERIGACAREDLVDAFDLDVVRGVRAFLFRLDPDRLEGRGAAVVELVDPRVVKDAEDEIPGLSLLRRDRTIGGVKVFDVNIPSFPSFSYAVVGTTAIAGLGGTIDAVLAGGMGQPDDVLARVELRPRALSADEWDRMLAPLVARDRARRWLIERLRAWKLGTVTLALEGSALVLSAHGQR